MEYVQNETFSENNRQISPINGTRSPENNGPAIDRSMVLENALQVISEAGATTAIVTQNSEPIGSVDLNTIVNTMTNPPDENKRGKIYT